MMQKSYLSCAETAKLVRSALKESFPGIKFSVRSHTYAGGASIRIGWIDGPNTRQVDQVAKSFEGKYFDGMIDYAGYKNHALDGKPVSLGASYVFTEREYSDAAIARALRICGLKYGATGSVEQYKKGGLWSIETSVGESLGTMVHRELSRFTDRVKAGASPTLRRLNFTGDDGYGRGTVGPYFTGGENAYRAMDEARRRQEG